MRTITHFADIHEGCRWDRSLSLQPRGPQAPTTSQPFHRCPTDAQATGIPLAFWLARLPRRAGRSLSATVICPFWEEHGPQREFLSTRRISAGRSPRLERGILASKTIVAFCEALGGRRTQLATQFPGV